MSWNSVGTAIGLLLTAYFGLRSLFQTQDFESLQESLRAYHQAMYNNLWRIGEDSERGLKASDWSEAREFAKAAAEISQTARHTLIAFSKEHSRFVPFYEPAWQPTPDQPDLLVQKK
jgi:hypothetical protein